jgi:hypothetical protein
MFKSGKVVGYKFQMIPKPGTFGGMFTEDVMISDRATAQRVMESRYGREYNITSGGGPITE